jgi:hypothetical protein
MLLFLLSLSFAVWDDDAVFVMIGVMLTIFLPGNKRSLAGRTSTTDDLCK